MRNTHVQSCNPFIGDTPMLSVLHFQIFLLTSQEYRTRKMIGIHRLSLGFRPLVRVLRGKHTLPDLPYDYNALEPAISAQIMQLHHQKHHATYVNALNVAEEKTQEALAKGDLRSAIQLQPLLKFNGGGHINHSIFWTVLAKDGGGGPSGELLKAIEHDFGSVQKMQEKVSTTAVSVQGSGWSWLGYSKELKRLQVAACVNQDPLESTTGLIPIFGIDVWEHAYYLQYKNVRPDYIKAVWTVVNWKNVEDRFLNALNESK